MFLILIFMYASQSTFIVLYRPILSYIVQEQHTWSDILYPCSSTAKDIGVILLVKFYVYGIAYYLSFATLNKIKVEYNSAQCYALQNKASSGSSSINDCNCRNVIEFFFLKKEKPQ